MNKKLLPKFKVADGFDLRTLDTDITVRFLEEKIKLREAAVEEKLRRQLLR